MSISAKGLVDDSVSESTTPAKPKAAGLLRGNSRVSLRYKYFGTGSPLSQRSVVSSTGSLVPRILASQTAETVVGLVIIANFVVVAHETDLRARTGVLSVRWVEIANVAFLAFYILEFMARLYVERWRYFKNGWNNLDFSVLMCSLLAEIINAASASSVSLLRTCRLVRLLRSMRLLISFRELWLLIRGLLSAMRTLFWAALLILILCTLWSILCVELIHPHMHEIFQGEDCERCPRAFASVMDANLTIFQMISGGADWGELAVPIMEKMPLTSFVFITLIFTMSFGMLNLITAVIVDTAAQARQEDHEAMAQMKDDEQRRAKKNLERIFHEMDTDGSGGVTLQELIVGAEQCPEFIDTMKVFELEQSDLTTVFEILDEHQTGSANLDEFTDLLWRMKSRDNKTTLLFLKHYVMDIRRKINAMTSTSTASAVAQSLKPVSQVDSPHIKAVDAKHAPNNHAQLMEDQAVSDKTIEEYVDHLTSHIHVEQKKVTQSAVVHKMEDTPKFGISNVACAPIGDSVTTNADEKSLVDSYNHALLQEGESQLEDSELDSDSTVDHSGRLAPRFLQESCHRTAKGNLSRASTGFSCTSQSSAVSTLDSQAIAPRLISIDDWRTRKIPTEIVNVAVTEEDAWGFGRSWEIEHENDSVGSLSGLAKHECRTGNCKIPVSLSDHALCAKVAAQKAAAAAGAARALFEKRDDDPVPTVFWPPDPNRDAGCRSPCGSPCRSPCRSPKKWSTEPEQSDCPCPKKGAVKHLLDLRVLTN